MPECAHGQLYLVQQKVEFPEEMYRDAGFSPLSWWNRLWYQKNGMRKGVRSVFLCFHCRKIFNAGIGAEIGTF